MNVQKLLIDNVCNVAFWGVVCCSLSVHPEQETRQQSAALSFHAEWEGASIQKAEVGIIWRCE